MLVSCLLPSLAVTSILPNDCLMLPGRSTCIRDWPGLGNIKKPLVLSHYLVHYSETFLICKQGLDKSRLYVSQARESVFQFGANFKAALKLGADNIRILAKFSFELILLYIFAPEVGADQSVCRYTFCRAC